MDGKWWNGAPGEVRGDERKQPGRGGFGHGYECVDCDWTGGQASMHHKLTGHAVRGRQWPAHWPNAQFADADANGRRRDAQRKGA